MISTCLDVNSAVKYYIIACAKYMARILCRKRGHNFDDNDQNWLRVESFCSDIYHLEKLRINWALALRDVFITFSIWMKLFVDIDEKNIRSNNFKWKCFEWKADISSWVTAIEWLNRKVGLMLSSCLFFFFWFCFQNNSDTTKGIRCNKYFPSDNGPNAVAFI